MSIKWASERERINSGALFDTASDSQIVQSPGLHEAGLFQQTGGRGGRRLALAPSQII